MNEKEKKKKVIRLWKSVKRFARCSEGFKSVRKCSKHCLYVFSGWVKYMTIQINAEIGRKLEHTVVLLIKMCVYLEDF